MTEEQWIKALKNIDSDQLLKDISLSLFTLNRWEPFKRAFKGTGFSLVAMLAVFEEESRE